jgi:hypothetical protein
MRKRSKPFIFAVCMLLGMVSVSVNAQMAPADRSQLEVFFQGPQKKRVWTTSKCDDPNGSFIRYEVLPEKMFVLYMKREAFKGPPKLDMSNLSHSGFSTVRKLSGDSSSILISSDVSMRRSLAPEQSRTSRALEEKASGTLRLTLNTSPLRIEVVDFFIADPQDIHQKPPYKQFIKESIWVEGPRKGSPASANISCD